MRNVVIGLAIFLAAQIVIIFVFYSKHETPITVQEQKVDTLRKKDIELEQKFDDKLNSFALDKTARKEINKTIETAINSILKKNEKDKHRTINATDSVKFFISDSMLGANGYKP